MILIPLQTDAPIYHRPVVTVALMMIMLALGLAVFFGVPDELTPWMKLVKSMPMLHLQAFSGLYFLTSILFQAPFLWIFGQIIEGKLGAVKFLLVLGVNIFLLVFTAIGLSCIYTPFADVMIIKPVIYSLLGMSLIWAPKNEVLMLIGVFFFSMRSFIFEITVYSFAIWFMLLEICLMLLAMFSFSWSLEVMNFLGVIYGAVLGIIMLKCRMVDCENWDIFSVTQGKHLKTIADFAKPQTVERIPTQFKKRGTNKKKSKRLKTRQEQPVEKSSGWSIKKKDVIPHANLKKKTNLTDRTSLLEKIQAQLDAGKPNAAYSEYQQILTRLPGFKLPAPLLLVLSQAMFKSGHYNQVVPLYEEYVEYFPDEAAEIRLRLAGILIEKEQRPAAGLRVLKKIPPNSLSESHEDYRLQLTEQAEQMVNDGVIEFEK